MFYVILCRDLPLLVMLSCPNSLFFHYQDYRDILSKLAFDGPHGSPSIVDHE